MEFYENRYKHAGICFKMCNCIISMSIARIIALLPQTGNRSSMHMLVCFICVICVYHVYMHINPWEMECCGEAKHTRIQ